MVVLGFDQDVTKQLILGFGEGTVGHENLSAPHYHGVAVRMDWRA
jgi:hypothetical protein